MSKVKNDNYICIQGFMVNELKLKGNELMIYAIIYGFSQDGENAFDGSLQYLADWTNSTKQGVIKCLKSLVQKKLIVKIERFVNGVKFCSYKVLNKNEQGIKQSLMPPLNKVELGIKQSLHNNINNNIKDNIDYNNDFSCGKNHGEAKDKTKKNVSVDKKEVKKQYPKEAVEITELLLSECQKTDSKFNKTEKQLDSWKADFEKLNRIDGRDWAEIRQVLLWAKADNFWSANILSAGKFREKYPTLIAQMQRNRKGKPFMSNDVYTGEDW